jgi:hypothetical protein
MIITRVLMNVSITIVIARLPNEPPQLPQINKAGPGGPAYRREKEERG